MITIFRGRYERQLANLLNRQIHRIDQPRMFPAGIGDALGAKPAAFPVSRSEAVKVALGANPRTRQGNARSSRSDG
jgi:hypothetical protein